MTFNKFSKEIEVMWGLDSEARLLNVNDKHPTCWMPPG